MQHVITRQDIARNFVETEDCVAEKVWWKMNVMEQLELSLMVTFAAQQMKKLKN